MSDDQENLDSCTARILEAYRQMSPVTQVIFMAFFRGAYVYKTIDPEEGYRLAFALMERQSSGGHVLVSDLDVFGACPEKAEVD